MTNQNKRNLILLPGLDGTGALFDDLVDQLEEKFHIICLSYPSNQHCSLDDLAQMVKDKMPDPQNTIILAESFSGLVALTLLEKLLIHPKGIIFGMCFVEPPFKALLRVVSKIPIKHIPWIHIPDAMYRKFCLGNSATKQQVKNLQKVLSKVNPGVIFQRLRLIETFRIPDQSKNWDIPCGYIQATMDRLISYKAAFWFSQNFQSFSLKTIPGPHFLMQSQAEQCATYILDFDQYLETGRKIS